VGEGEDRPAVRPAPPNPDPGDERVEVVDEDGRVLRVVSRRQMRERNLRHRATYIAVLDGAGRLLVHQRATWKDVSPGFWDLCFGGVVSAGEPWREAAARELAEEAGITGVDLRELGPLRYEADDGRIVGRVYLGHWDGPLGCPDGEVIALDRIALSELDSWVARHRVCPDSVAGVAPLLRDLREAGPA